MVICRFGGSGMDLQNKTRDMESLVETMMQQLLSKEVLHEAMKEIGERYPKWLQDNKSNLNQEEYDRFFHQHELIIDLNVVYDIEHGNFNKIIELMQKMQEYGQPPNDIVKELAPILTSQLLVNFWIYLKEIKMRTSWD